MRIVSLLPSATEIICALGLEEQLVGVTHECDYPPAVRGLPAVTRSALPAQADGAEIDRQVRAQLVEEQSLYHLDREMLARLAPDLIVTQTLCDVCAVAETEVEDAACTLPGNPRVLNLEPETLEDVLRTLRQVGEAAGVPARAASVVAELRDRIAGVQARTASTAARPRTALLEWLQPPFSCGHWSPELVAWAGGREGFGRPGARSRTLTWDVVAQWNPEAVIVACCGFDLAQTASELRAVADVSAWAQLAALHAGRVYVVDGSQYFSRPGPRLVDSLESMAHALHPDIHPPPPYAPTATTLAALLEAH